MGAIRMIFRAIGGIYLLGVVLVGIGGTWLQYKMKDVGGEIEASAPKARAYDRSSEWQRERSSRSYAREEEYEVRQAERESMGCDPSYNEC